MQIESVTPRQLIRELADGNPPPVEKWFQRDSFDPAYGMSEIRAAVRNGWLELDDSDGAETCRFRLTAKGRMLLAKGTGV